MTPKSGPHPGFINGATLTIDGIRQTNPSIHAGPILIHSRHDQKRRG